MLEISNLSVGYPWPAMVRGISLTVAEAEGVCLIGANGAGKTTTLRGVVGLAHRISGEIHKDSQAISSSPGNIVKHGVSYVPEGRHVFAQLSVEENLLVAALALKTPRATIRERLEALYARFPMLSTFRKRAAGQLSGGQQQIVAISRALMQQPSVLLIDEPSLGLSPIAVDEVVEVLTGLVKDGLSLLLVEQNIEIALSLCQRGYVLRSGELVGSGTSDELARMNIVEELYFGATA